MRNVLHRTCFPRSPPTVPTAATYLHTLGPVTYNKNQMNPAAEFDERCTLSPKGLEGVEASQIDSRLKWVGNTGSAIGDSRSATWNGPSPGWAATSTHTWILSWPSEWSGKQNIIMAESFLDGEGDSDSHSHRVCRHFHSCKLPCELIVNLTDSEYQARDLPLLRSLRNNRHIALVTNQPLHCKRYPEL